MHYGVTSCTLVGLGFIRILGVHGQVRGGVLHPQYVGYLDVRQQFLPQRLDALAMQAVYATFSQRTQVGIRQPHASFSMGDVSADQLRPTPSGLSAQPFTQHLLVRTQAVEVDQGDAAAGCGRFIGHRRILPQWAAPDGYHMRELKLDAL